MKSNKELSSKLPEYLEVVRNILWNCQVIEAGLRRYISSSYDFIRIKLGDELPFHLNMSDLEKDSMGKLIRKFSKLSNDSEFIKELENLVPHRNKCAHEGFAIKYKFLFDESYFETKLEDLKAIYDKSEDTASKIRNIYKNLEERIKTNEKR